MTDQEKYLKEVKEQADVATEGHWEQYKNGPGVFINSGKEKGA